MSVEASVPKTSQSIARKMFSDHKKVVQTAVAGKRPHRHYWKTRIAGWQNRSHFDDVACYVSFVGHARSGHSLVGAQLTAHCNMIISNELNALAFIRAGYRRNQLFEMIRQHDFRFCLEANCEHVSSYNYHVPGQWQGKTKRLTVIGDKKGHFTSRLLMDDPSLMTKLQDTVQVPLRFLHVIRNPFDIIATIHLRSGKTQSIDDVAIEFFCRCQMIARMIEEYPDLVLTIRHEDYVDNPQLSLGRICDYIGVESPADYLNDCAKVVRKSPHHSRDKIQWTKHQIDFIQRQFGEFDFLDGYAFHEPHVAKLKIA